MSNNQLPNEATRPVVPALGRRGVFLALFAIAAGVGACGTPPAKAPNPTRSIDERRAIEIIIRGFRDQGDKPVRGREVEIQEGKKLQIDVGSEGHLYGVAYVTSNDRAKLGNALPPRDASMGEALQLVRGTGDDREARILILQDTEYMYDDQVGTEHEATIITAENKLARDVRDFVLRAQADKWP